MIKRLISILLTVVMLFSLMSAAAFAANSGEVGYVFFTDASGLNPSTSGSGKTFKFTVTGVNPMTVSIEKASDSISGPVTIPATVSDGTNTYSVTSINTFQSCYEITSLTVPSSVKSIGDNAFNFCANLKELHIDSIESWCSVSFVTSYSNPLYKNGGKLYVNNTEVTELVIPSTVTAIPDYAFGKDTGLTSVIISNGVESIGKSAFAGCTGLTSVTIPSSVNSIGLSAFYNCSNLKELHIGSIESWCSVSFGTNAHPFISTSNGKLYVNNTEVTELVIPSAVKAINNYAFATCAGITSVTLPSSVESIGKNAFQGCGKLTSVVVKATTPPTLDSTAFSNCTSLSAISVPAESVDAYKEATTWSSYKNMIQALPELGSEGNPWQIGTPSAVSVKAYIKDGTLYISGAGAMKDYPNVDDAPWASRKAEIATVMIESGVTHIGEAAFESFNALETVYIPSSVTTIGADAFLVISGSKIANLHIDSIESWCEITFSGDQYKRPLNNLIPTKKLYINGEETTELVIPGSMKSIPDYVFVGWPITSAVLESGVESIGDYAFQNCGSLESITMPNGVTNIGDAAFSNCSNLKEVTIPSSVTTIGDESFYDCENLDTVICNATNPPTVDCSFDDCAETLKIYVPANSVSEYKTVWSKYASMIEDIPTVADMLNKAANFPTTRETGWTNGNGVYIFRSSEIDGIDKLNWYSASSPNPLGPVNESLNGLDYIEFGDGRIIFNLDNNGVLVSITFVDVDDSINGTYTHPAPAPVYSGGGDSSTTVSVPVSGDANSVKVQATVSGSTATVKKINDADLEKVAEGESVSIDLSAAGKNVDTAKIPTETVEKIAEKSAMTVKLPVATVEFDKAATEEIADQAKGSNIELVVDDIKEVSLNAVQKESVKKLDTAIIIDAHLASNGKMICSEDNGGFGGGSAKVILPYEIKNNRKPENYSVFYVNEAGKLEKLNAAYDEELKAFVFEIEHFSVYAVAFEQFADIDANAYYYDAVKWAATNGITDGVDETHFNPGGITNRAQMVTFLWRYAGKPEPTIIETPFTDLDPDWYYYKAVLWAYENGITDGTSATTFEPNKNVSRAQTVTFLWRYAGKPVVNYYMNMTDVADDRYYTEAVRWALSEKITEGTTTTTFSPNDDCLRGQIVTFLYRDFAE